MTTTDSTTATWPAAPPLVFYHDRCRDGFCAAWVINDSISGCGFVGCQYGSTPEKLNDIVASVKARRIIMVDFSFPRPFMDLIAASATSLLVLDHHKTAQAALDGFEAEMKAQGHDVQVIFDMERSGAGLAWDHFHPTLSRPPIVDYVEDRDLWKFKLPHSKQVNAFLGTLPSDDFAAWSAAECLSVHHMAEFGTVVERKIDQYVDALKGNARRVMLDGHSVPCVNAPQVDISELLGALALECQPDAPSVLAGKIEPAPFVVGWWQRGDGKFQYSLRSVATADGGFDVSEIAKKFGGGGHRNAAGFESAEYIFAEGLGYALDERDRAELEWWRTVFSTRFQPGNLPQPGRELAGRRFSLYQDISDGTKVKTQFGIPGL